MFAADIEANREKLAEEIKGKRFALFAGQAASEPFMKPVIMTSEVIPKSFLLRDDTPLPIFSFQEMKVKGCGILG